MNDDIKNEHSFKVTVKTTKDEKTIELLTPETLRLFGMTLNDINSVSPDYAVPGCLYEEIGIARINHPCAGSVCAVFKDPLGQRCSIDFIVYHDRNPLRNHAGGNEHYNTGVRCVRENKTIRSFPSPIGHVIEDSPYIEIISDCDGIIERRKVLRDQQVKRIGEV